MKKLFYLILFLGCMCIHTVHGKGSWTSDWGTSASLSGGSGRYLPFWAHTCTYGIAPATSNALLFLGADVAYKTSNGFFFESGVNIAGWLAASVADNGMDVNGAVDRLYASAGWKMLRADIGMLPHQKELGELSITGGNMMWTSNARNLPGINLKSDWIPVLKWFAIRGNLAHYKMNDNRAVFGTMLHDKSLEAKFTINSRVSVSAGLEHIVQWGGTSERYGDQPASFNDYVRIFFAMKGGDDALETDKINVLGNHLGREYARIDWTADSFGLVLQYDKPYEDGSGLRLLNVPDGVWTVKFDLKDSKSFVNELVYEYVNTTWQSGPLHDRPATEEEMKNQDPSDPFYGRISLRGRDNYFGNSVYESGWTYYGCIIGLPLIGGLVFDDDGIVRNVVCSRVRAHHLGIGGNLTEGCPYKLKATYSRNYGRYDQSEDSVYATAPWQLSMAMEVGVQRKITKLPVEFWVGAYSDLGKLYQDSFGLTLKVIHRGSRTF